MGVDGSIPTTGKNNKESTSMVQIKDPVWDSMRNTYYNLPLVPGHG